MRGAFISITAVATASLSSGVAYVSDPYPDPFLEGAGKVSRSHVEVGDLQGVADDEVAAGFDDVAHEG